MARSRCPSSAVLLPLWAVLWSSAAVAAPPPVAPAYLVRDIGTQTRPSASSYPSAFVALGDAIYFLASPGNLNGRELWRTDGTPSGTVRVVNLVSEEVWEFRPDHLTALRDGLVFTLGRHSTGVELWASDGTAAGTRLLKDLRPGPDGSNPADLVAVGDLLFFTADDGESGRELWRSDGTADGTMRVADFNLGPDGAFAQELTGVGERLYFTIYRIGHGRELWVSDGSSAGTVPVEGLPPADEGQPHFLAAVAGSLYFAAEDTATGSEPWRVDAAGHAARIADVNPGPDGSSPREFVGHDGAVCFLARHPDGRDLWCTDGSTEGTSGIATGAVFLGNLISSGGLLYFSAREEFPRSEIHPGRDLWRSDGTPEGTMRLGVLHGDIPGGPRYRLVAFRDSVVYGVNGGIYPGGWLAGSDGTPDGTGIIRSGDVTSLTAIGDRLYFETFDDKYGSEPWISDGTAAGTMLLRDLAPGTDAQPGELTAVGNNVLFTALGDDVRRGLWRSDGTGPGTAQIPTDGASDVGGLLAAGSSAFFTAHMPSTGRELWHTNGFGAGLVRDIHLGAADSNLALLGALGSVAVFGADDGSGGGTELWRSDGTADGTVLIRDLDPVGGSDPFGFAVLGEDAYFAAGSELGYELWRTDGSEAGTVLVKDINPGPPDSLPVRLVAADSLLFFRAVEGLGDVELWRSDGTEAGTLRVRDINPGAGPSFPSGLAALPGDVIVFAASDGVHGVEPWRSDGTEAGTFALGDLLAGSESSITAPSEPEIRFVVAGRQAFFVADDGSRGRELWRTDGTVEGTRLVRDVFAGSGPAFAPYLTGSLTAVGPSLLFAAFDLDGGNELWRSDGTEGGRGESRTLPLVPPRRTRTASRWPVRPSSLAPTTVRAGRSSGRCRAPPSTPPARATATGTGSSSSPSC